MSAVRPSLGHGRWAQGGKTPRRGRQEEEARVLRDASTPGPSGRRRWAFARTLCSALCAFGEGIKSCRTPFGARPPSLRQCNAMHPNAGSVRPTRDVTARKPRYYGRFNQSVLWRDVMREKTSGNLAFFAAWGAQEPSLCIAGASLGWPVKSRQIRAFGPAWPRLTTISRTSWPLRPTPAVRG
jgi:hypothetical protein